jgi:hypothetical protein
MSNDAIIKKVEGYTIDLSDSNKYGMNWLKFLTYNIIIGIMYFVLYFNGLSKPIILTSIEKYPVDILPIIWIMIILITLIIEIVITESSMYSTPSYRVSCSCWDVDTITVIKTTTDADQIAICKAAQKIESDIKLVIQRTKELETIASKCK